MGMTSSSSLSGIDRIKTYAVGVVYVAIKPMDDPTIAKAATITVKQGLEFKGKMEATDLDGGALEYVVNDKSGITHGTLTYSKDGAFSYKYAPAEGKECMSGQACSDFFFFSAKQGANALSAAAKIQINIVDDKAPTVLIGSDKRRLKAGESAKIAIVLSEVPYDPGKPGTKKSLTASNLVVTGGTLSNFAGSERSYTAVFTPAANSVAPGVISIAKELFTDAAGNKNIKGDLNPIIIDTQAPVVTIESDKAALKKGETAKITIKISEAVQGAFAMGMLDVEGGQLSNLAGEKQLYTATFTPAKNSKADGKVSIKANLLLDLAGNGNMAGALSKAISIDTN